MKFLRYLMIAWILVLQCSCVATQADLDRLADAQRVWQIEQADAFSELAEGTLSPEAYETRSKALREDFLEEVEDIKADMEERGSGLLGVLSANPLESAVGAAALIAGAMKGTNMMRDGKRKQRGEAV